MQRCYIFLCLLTFDSSSHACMPQQSATWIRAKILLSGEGHVNLKLGNLPVTGPTWKKELERNR